MTIPNVSVTSLKDFQHKFPSGPKFYTCPRNHPPPAAPAWIILRASSQKLLIKSGWSDVLCSTLWEMHQIDLKIGFRIPYQTKLLQNKTNHRSKKHHGAGASINQLRMDFFVCSPSRWFKKKTSKKGHVSQRLLWKEYKIITRDFSDFKCQE